MLAHAHSPAQGLRQVKNCTFAAARKHALIARAHSGVRQRRADRIVCVSLGAVFCVCVCVNKYTLCANSESLTMTTMTTTTSSD